MEDPIEYLHHHRKSIINQREVGSDTLSFESALVHALREDPDVILVGEMRNLETIALTLTAAETGHLVLATLHTSNAPQSIDRIVDVFPPHQQTQVRIQLAGCIQGIISQQLLPRANGKGRLPAIEIMRRWTVMGIVSFFLLLAISPLGAREKEEAILEGCLLYTSRCV